MISRNPKPSGRMLVTATLLGLILVTVLTGCGAKTTSDTGDSTAPSVGPVSGLPVVMWEDLPPEAQDTIRLIDQGGPLLASGALEPGIYRCETLEEPASIKDELAEQGWRGFYLDGRLIEDKPSLLKAIAEAMSFPGYVANNWDALEEAIRDLEWAPGAGYLVIYDYPQIFAAYQPQEWQTALSILHSAIGYWRTQDVPMFVLLCKTEEGLADVSWL